MDGFGRPTRPGNACNRCCKRVNRRIEPFGGFPLTINFIIVIIITLILGPPLPLPLQQQQLVATPSHTLMTIWNSSLVVGHVLVLILSARGLPPSCGLDYVVSPLYRPYSRTGVSCVYSTEWRYKIKCVQCKHKERERDILN